jgi:phosphatidylinositol alpha-mannosyltransferase
MRIGFVLDDSLDSTDGVQQYVLTLGTWLGSQGHDIHYLVGETTRNDLPHVHSLSRNMRVKFNGNRMTMPLPARQAEIQQLLEIEKFDVLHVQMPYSPFMASKVIMCAPFRTAVIGTFHIAPHSGLVHHATRLLALLLKRSLDRFDYVMSVSTAAQSFARQTFGMESDVLPNVVVRSRFAAAEPYPLSGTGPVIMFLGRLVKRKGCMVLLQAVQRLHAAYPDIPFRVVVCGRGPLEAGLKDFVRQYRLEKVVRFAGYLSEEDKPRYLRAADIAVFPSSGGESFGIVLLEAMAAGRPVVLGAANDGYKSVLAPYPDALFPIDDAAALSGKLHGLLSDESRRNNAREWQEGYIQQFDVAVVGQHLIEIYQAAADRRAGHPSQKSAGEADNSMRK